MYLDISGASTLGNFMQLVGVAVIFLFVLVATYLTSKWVGTYQQGQSKNKNIKVIETYKINQNKYIQIIKIADKNIVIAVSKDNVDFLTELEESSLVVKSEEENNEFLFKNVLNKMIQKTEVYKKNKKN